MRIADDPRFAATPLIQAKELKMQVRWLPLLRWKIEIKSFVLGEPEFQIIRNEGGDFNILAPLCIGVGQGIATIVERVQ